jgi:hypothetical protein
MIEELNLEGKWWLPDRYNEKFDGSLTIDQQQKRGVLSIMSGPNFLTSEMGAKAKHDIILGETSEGQKVTLNNCQGLDRRDYGNDLGKYSITAENILLGGYFETRADIIFRSIYVTYRGSKINYWFDKRFGVGGSFNSSESSEKESFIRYTPS